MYLFITVGYLVQVITDFWCFRMATNDEGVIDLDEQNVQNVVDDENVVDDKDDVDDEIDVDDVTDEANGQQKKPKGRIRSIAWEHFPQLHQSLHLVRVVEL